MRRRTCRGMTITEWLVVVVIVLLCSGVILLFLRGELEFVDGSTLQGDVRARNQLALDVVAADLRQATRKAAGSPPNVSIPAAPSNTGLTLYRPADLNADGRIVDNTGAIEWDTAAPVQYQYDSAAQQLLRIGGGVTRVVAHHVTGVTFEDKTIDPSLGSNEIRVRVTMQETTSHQRTLTASNSTVIRLRN